METPHIQFTWSSDVLATILDSLGIQGLGSFDKTTGLYSAWPEGERWALYTAKIRQWMPALLSNEECETIEKKLTAVESAFNAYLSEADAGNLTALQKMIEQLGEIEALIRNRGRDFHAAFPYFARWFTLNIAVVHAFMNHDHRAGQIQGLKLWWRGRDYLERVSSSAHAARANQIATALTGAFRDRIYVLDERTGTP